MRGNNEEADWLEGEDLCTYVRLVLIGQNKDVLTQFETSKVKGSVTVFNEAFHFNVPLFQLDAMTLLVGAFVDKMAVPADLKRKKKCKVLIGWLAFGSSVDDEMCKESWMELGRKQDDVGGGGGGGEGATTWYKLMRPL
ncbi:hypothetical protein HELRODRAFT_170693 [Helobdella robusta]|uniref:C2 domain-containing protein n=1 Tax=Helobdella robusta TaxID=6412 RepID=T1F3B7_HELRO|nr:hypothetical protein HELRODRAFT_170693 [Helobdella robusta]ESO07360.1 hypothetical protein HELRODRAFT_170693 [Helobdella robusta]